MISTRHFPWLLVALLLTGCSREEPKTNALKPVHNRAAGGYQTLAEVPDPARQSVTAFASALETNLREGKAAEAQAAFDSAAMADATFEGVSASGPRLDQFKAGMQKGMLNSIKQISQLWSQQDTKFKGLVIYQSQLAARFRFVTENGAISVIDLVPRTNRQGRLAIANFCNQTMGYDLVEQSRQAAAPILAELDKGFLQRVLNKPEITPEQLTQFGNLVEKSRAGDVPGTIATYRSLPDALRNTLAATGLYIITLQRGNDMEAYKQALQEAATRFDSASFRFMLVDLYAMDKKYDEAAGCVDAFMEVVGRDAVLLTLKSLMQNAKGDVPAARQTLREAFELEPDCTYVHSKGLDVLLAARDYPAVRDSLLFLEKNAGYHFKGQMADPLWDEFKQAPESAPWR